MLVFWLACALLLILASLAFVVPIIRDKKPSQVDRDELNKVFYQGRMQEIEQDDEQGIISDKQGVITELQRGLVDDVTEQAAPQSRVSNITTIVPGVIVLVLLCIGFYLQFGSHKQVTHWQQVMADFPALQQKMIMGQGAAPTEIEVDNFMLALRTQLSEKPNDATGWLMLGRLAIAVRDGQLALDALAKAYELDATRSDIRVPYAQALLQSGEPLNVKKAENLLVATIGLEPENLQAWSIYAFMALQNEDFELAITRWQKMVPLLQNDPERLQMVQGSINYAQQQLGQKAAESAPAETADIGHQYNVSVQLDPNVTLPAQGYVFIFAQMVTGPAMPLAAKKLPLGDIFPLTITLSDADAMQPSFKLSQQAEFKVKARISMDENASVAAGEWEGVSAPVQSGETGTINVVIDTQM